MSTVESIFKMTFLNLIQGFLGDKYENFGIVCRGNFDLSGDAI